MRKVVKGEDVVIAADTWNAMLDAADYVKNRRNGGVGRGVSAGLHTGIVLVMNGETDRRERFTALALTDVAVRPEDNEDEFLDRPAVYVGRVTDESREGMPYAILLEPLEAEEIGRAAILGVVPAKVTVTDETDGYAAPAVGSVDGALASAKSGTARILWRESGTGSRWCLLQLGGAGAGGEECSFMCRVLADDSGTAQNGFSVSVHPLGDPGGPSLGTATLYVPDLALDSALPDGAWIIAHRCALAATGGED